MPLHNKSLQAAPGFEVTFRIADAATVVMAVSVCVRLTSESSVSFCLCSCGWRQQVVCPLLHPETQARHLLHPRDQAIRQHGGPARSEVNSVDLDSVNVCVHKCQTLAALLMSSYLWLVLLFHIEWKSNVCVCV